MFNETKKFSLEFNGIPGYDSWPSIEFEFLDLKKLPSEAGVYIMGVKQGKFFLPLYVGETKNLNGRGTDAYSNIKELFDCSAPNDMYKDIYLWNFEYMKFSGKIEDRIKGLLHEKSTCLYLNHQEFFNSKLPKTSYLHDLNPTHDEIISELESIANGDQGTINLAKSMKNTSNYIQENREIAFWKWSSENPFKIDSADPNQIEPYLYCLEMLVKLSLDSLGLHTFGHLSGSFKKAYFALSPPLK
jgi:hypothetical protein